MLQCFFISLLFGSLYFILKFTIHNILDSYCLTQTHLITYKTRLVKVRHTAALLTVRSAQGMVKVRHKTAHLTIRYAQGMVKVRHKTAHLTVRPTQAWSNSDTKLHT